MKVILAMDLMDGYVVHGKSGNRDHYKPLTWGLSPSAEPLSYLSVMKPKYAYVADLDRIGMCGDHTETILRLASIPEKLWVDRGCSIPEEYLPGVANIIGTETADAPFEEFTGGYLSVDVKDGKVIPDGLDPVEVIREADKYAFDGIILLNISSVGTESGIDLDFAKRIRAATKKPLLYGGGVNTLDDLRTLCDAGYDGVIISTSVHKGKIPVEIVQEGTFC
ncbi:histidine biosynthesis protein [Methanocorpusculum labreanum Z]|uniref:Histidine biosynthesis protein n=1 Tax=Methanocorpusculum labreanum (strain ATCC 43576 / DSM 4855 / Z) TaxID=410358 RepID=A2ST44_METLZ|nr:HisA/HisF-related TIM barrel protein [Methanocorpusculum labreanum]ABN07500.1 histidine biosynthesis protein [Methanocorpusculum labreanum Z]